MVDRFLEVLAVVLLGIATVGTAWCGLQATLWSGEQEQLSGVAAAEQAEANRLFGLASQAITYDAATVANYARAVSDGDEALRQFYRTALVREQFLGFLTAWETQVQAGQEPVNLLEDEEYLNQVMGPYREALATAEQAAEEAAGAGRMGHQYVLSTVLLAVALFFAGVTASFRAPTLRMALLGACLLVVAFSAGRLADLPVAPVTWTLLNQG